MLGHLLGCCFSLLCVQQDTECVLYSEEILVEEHRGVVTGNYGIPLAVLVIFYFLLILTGISPLLRVDSALLPTMLLMLLLILSFCSFLLCLVLLFQC